MKGKAKQHIVQITAELKHLYTDYCRAYRYDHDESDLYDEELLYFDPDPKVQPTLALVDEKGFVKGMISVRFMPYMNDKVRGRLSIFHTESDVLADYHMMLEAIMPMIGHLDHLYGFMPEKKAVMQGIMTNLKFEVERYVWVLTRPEVPVKPVFMPEDMRIDVFSPDQDAKTWCEVRNDAFQTLKGSETPLSELQVAEMCQTAGHLEQGMLILRQGETAIGVIRVVKEEEDGQVYAFIGPVAIKTAYQGRGLGRMLLRAGLKQSEQLGFKQAMLCVNADNAKAADLYLSEGFEKSVVMICYRLNIGEGHI